MLVWTQLHATHEPAARKIWKALYFKTEKLKNYIRDRRDYACTNPLPRYSLELAFRQLNLQMAKKFLLTLCSGSSYFLY
jgi:hypothetical protein